MFNSTIIHIIMGLVIEHFCMRPRRILIKLHMNDVSIIMIVIIIKRVNDR